MVSMAEELYRRAGRTGMGSRCGMIALPAHARGQVKNGVKNYWQLRGPAPLFVVVMCENIFMRTLCVVHLRPADTAATLLLFALLVAWLGGCGTVALTPDGLYYRVDNPHYHPVGSGTYKDGVKNGKGEVRWDNGDYYIGDLKDGLFQGRGLLNMDGDVYEGDFVNNTMHGHGTYRHTNGQTYTGQFRNDKRHGTGTYTWPDGDRYDGTYFLDEPHGKGILTMADGTRCAQVYDKGSLIKSCR